MVHRLRLYRLWDGCLWSARKHRVFHMFDILQYPFIQNAFIAGTCVAIVAAVMGYFLIVRGLTFAGHALPNIGFAGAAGAVLLGIDPVIGLLAFTISAALAIGILGKVIRERDIAVGIIMTFALGLGILFLSLYSGYAERVYSILFGQIVRIVHRPLWAILLAIILGICYTWLGIFFAANGTWPVSFYIATISFGVYLPIRLLSPLWIGQRARKSMSLRQGTLSPGFQSSEDEPNDVTKASGRVSGIAR